MASPSLVPPPLASPMACRSRRLTHYSSVFVSAAILVVHWLLPELYQLPPKLTSLPHSPAPPEQPTSCCQMTYMCCQPMWSSLPYVKTTEVNGASAHPWAWTGKAVWELSQLPVFALPHSPTHPHTTPHTSHLRETSYSLQNRVTFLFPLVPLLSQSPGSFLCLKLRCSSNIQIKSPPPWSLLSFSHNSSVLWLAIVMQLYLP